MEKTGTIRIGISGWTYKPWRGIFYPKKLPHKQELAYAAQQFPSIEINGTFYGLQRPSSFTHWREQTPDDFVFALKGSRYITHMRRLRDIEIPLANFLASGILKLGPKLGPILWQFPARFPFDAGIFRNFFDLLPRTTEDAAKLSRKHQKRAADRVWTEAEEDLEIRHAVEIRHDSYRDPAFIDLLREKKIALVCADTVEWPRLMDLTTDFIYCRLHGSEQLYVSGYDDKSLNEWAARIKSWVKGEEPENAERIKPPTKPYKSGRDVYLYFDNDAKVRAPEDARSLMEKVK